MVESSSRSPICPQQHILFDQESLIGLVETQTEGAYIGIPNLFPLQQVKFKGWNEPITVESQDPEHSYVAGQVANFFSTGIPAEDWRIPKQRPFNGSPFTRNLEVLLPDGKILVIGGVLVSDRNLIEASGNIKNPNINSEADEDYDLSDMACTLPDPRRSLNQALSSLGLELQGYSDYDPQAKILNDHVAQLPILGGYSKEGLDNKLDLHKAAEVLLQGLDIIMPRTILRGEYQDPELGSFYAYVRPVTFDMTALVDIDKTFIEAGLSSNVLANALEAVANRVRAMHNKGFIHLQLHPGNWGVTAANFLNGENGVYIGDYETSAYDPAMPVEPKIIDLMGLFSRFSDALFDEDTKGSLLRNPDYFNKVLFSFVQGYLDQGYNAQKLEFEYKKMQQKVCTARSPEEIFTGSVKYLTWAFGRVYRGYHLDDHIMRTVRMGHSK